MSEIGQVLKELREAELAASASDRDVALAGTRTAREAKQRLRDILNKTPRSRRPSI